MNEHLHHFVATHRAIISAALIELALVIPRCSRIDQFSRSFLLAACHL